jgi:NADH dehydrogenase
MADSAPATAATHVEGHPHVVIIGAGFAGLAAASKLGGAPVNVTLIDRRNYHLFVPLLYQVASAALSPADIAEPIRRILSRHSNIEVMLADVTGIDKEARWSSPPVRPTAISAMTNGNGTRPA